MASTCRLGAILAADVAGYSRLMGADVDGTHERLVAHFRQLIDPKMKERQGASSRTPAMGCRRNFRAWSTRCATPPKCSAGYSTASRWSPTSGGSGSGSASISASMPGLFSNGRVLAPSSPDGARVRKLGIERLHDVTRTRSPDSVPMSSLIICVIWRGPASLR